MIHGAFVTGGASGIGAAVSARLRADGIPVVVADINAGAEPSVHCDVQSAESNANAVAQATRLLPRLDLAVLCAGISAGPSTLDAMDVEVYRRMVATNLDGVVFGIRAAAPVIRDGGGGAIVVIASLAALSPPPENPIYAMTKAGVVGLVRALGPVLARDGITCNAVCPGFTDTPMVDRLRAQFHHHGFPLIAPETVVDAVLTAASSTESGETFMVQAGHETVQYRFRGVPGARVSDTGPPVRVPGRDAS